MLYESRLRILPQIPLPVADKKAPIAEPWLKASTGGPDHIRTIVIVHDRRSHLTFMIRKPVEQLLEEVWSENNIIIQEKHILTPLIEGDANTLIVSCCHTQVLAIFDHNVFAILIGVQLSDGTVRRTIIDRDQHEVPENLLI
jgi:hypothetical protein